MLIFLVIVSIILGVICFSIDFGMASSLHDLLAIDDISLAAPLVVICSNCDKAGVSLCDGVYLSYWSSWSLIFLDLIYEVIGKVIS